MKPNGLRNAGKNKHIKQSYAHRRVVDRHKKTKAKKNYFSNYTSEFSFDKYIRTKNEVEENWVGTWEFCLQIKCEYHVKDHIKKLEILIILTFMKCSIFILQNAITTISNLPDVSFSVDFSFSKKEQKSLKRNAKSLLISGVRGKNKVEIY